jgi:hypothetical protein
LKVSFEVSNTAIDQRIHKISYRLVRVDSPDEDRHLWTAHGRAAATHSGVAPVTNFSAADGAKAPRQRRPSLREQAGQAFQPCDLSTFSATLICSDLLALCGEPLPP